MALILRYAVRSDLGLVRGNNEDSVYAGPRLLAIADGMGGHAAGEVASKIVIGAMENLDEDRAPADLMRELRDAVAEGNHQIAAASRRSPDLEGMGTTLTALRFAGSHVGLVHVGDSRAYLLRADQLSQITHDDTYVQFLVDSGKITPDEAKDHPRKSVILRALTGTEVDPDVSIREARAGDRYLLCTDGLSDVVSAETILETMRIADVQECADRLVELALRGGGPDNVTVVVADVVTARAGDTVDDVPVIAGAFVDPSAADVPGDDSPAERAARLGRTTAESRTPPPPERRGRWRTPLWVLGVLALVVAGLGGTYAWTQTQYFVGRDGSEVAIFRGVNTAFGPLRFFDVHKNTDLKLADLYPSVRSQVQSGITARSESDAEQIVSTLQGQLMPYCPVTSGLPPISPSSSPVSASPTGSRATAKPSARTTAKSSAKSSTKSTAKSGASRATPTPTPTPTPSRTLVPSVDCREVP